MAPRSSMRIIWSLQATVCASRKSHKMVHKIDIKFYSLLSNFPASGLNRIMKPNQIKAIVGLHKISEYKNEISRSEAEKQRPVEMSVKNFIVHPGMEWLFSSLSKFLDQSITNISFLPLSRIRLRQGGQRHCTDRAE